MAKACWLSGRSKVIDSRLRPEESAFMATVGTRSRTTYWRTSSGRAATRASQRLSSSVPVGISASCPRIACGCTDRSGSGDRAGPEGLDDPTCPAVCPVGEEGACLCSGWIEPEPEWVRRPSPPCFPPAGESEWEPAMFCGPAKEAGAAADDDPALPGRSGRSTLSALPD